MQKFREEIVQNFMKWRDGNLFYPLLMELKPTNRCNLDCISCKAMGDPNYDPKKEVPYKDHLRFIKKAKDLRRIHITGGGEPLSYPGIDKIFALIMDMDVEGSMTTNGTLFTENIIKNLVKGGWNHIFISLDGADSIAHDHLRGVSGTFDRVIKNINYLNECKKKYGKKTPTLELGMVLSKANIKQVKNYIELAHDLGARNVTLQPLRVKNETYGKDLMISDEEKKEFLRYLPELKVLSEKYNLLTNLDYFDDLFLKETGGMKEVIREYAQKHEKKESKIHCFHPWFFASVQPDGSVYPCSFITNNPFGNIHTESLKEIWHSPPFEKLRGNVSKDELPGFCNMCCGTNMMISIAIQELMDR